MKQKFHFRKWRKLSKAAHLNMTWYSACFSRSNYSMIKAWQNASTPYYSSKFWTSSTETELTRPLLFLLLLFFFSECLNLEDTLIIFFLRDPILVLHSSSGFSKSYLLSFFSSLLENPSKPTTITKTKRIRKEKKVADCY